MAPGQNNGTWTCEHCGSTFKAEKNLSNHQKESKCAAAQGTSTTWKCSRCDMTSSIKRSVKPTQPLDGVIAIDLNAADSKNDDDVEGGADAADVEENRSADESRDEAGGVEISLINMIQAKHNQLGPSQGQDSYQGRVGALFCPSEDRGNHQSGASVPVAQSAQGPSDLLSLDPNAEQPSIGQVEFFGLKAYAPGQDRNQQGSHGKVSALSQPSSSQGDPRHDQATHGAYSDGMHLDSTSQPAMSLALSHVHVDSVPEVDESVTKSVPPTQSSRLANIDLAAMEIEHMAEFMRYVHEATAITGTGIKNPEFWDQPTEQFNDRVKHWTDCGPSPGGSCT
ncbi:hypothetical protein N0V90_007825 [Kalmusia sp. IMI 367209]|nr:hypothetical protein N0V90_007825 [Kalmusia sp. IMI 367209]